LSCDIGEPVIDTTALFLLDGFHKLIREEVIALVMKIEQGGRDKDAAFFRP
jgi:hypothetical protein